ncbi:hypothetical protein [Rubinisphaera margarita]|uniref:hypothetical protein n=1 Tax=Rubinisphaera margarita TaxID=2909586 RepID=UPI001EE83ADE|nr:hypothetical protein [Rubinisphaera margarita]MCG6157277.1 hypothetical protein [Rubinisphaera margarita]
MDKDALWDIVHGCFDEDDGSLPSIAIQPLTPEEIALIFEIFVREGRITTEEPAFHDQQSDKLIPLDSVKNAASLVANYKASPFHLVVRDICFRGHQLPELGMFVFQESIEVDYRMGDDWDATTVFAFFEWLKYLVGQTKNGELAACTREGPPFSEQFDEAWHRFMKE